MTTQITLLAFDQCYTSGITNLLDVFHVANRLWQRRHPDTAPIFDWQVVSPDGRPVSTTSRLTLPVEGKLADVENTDMLIVPGSDFVTTKGYLELVGGLSQACGADVRRLHQAGAYITACCGGPFVLAACDIVKNERMTIAWWLAGLFQKTFPHITLDVDHVIIEDNGILTSGAAAYTDMAMHIVEQKVDRFLMLECARLLLVDANRMSQTPYLYLQQQVRHNDHVVLQAQDYFRANIGREFGLDDVATMLNVSKRTLIRRFKQAIGQRPIEYLQDLRLETAKRLLETSGKPLEQITYDVGYRDVSSFRRLFKQRTQLTPRQYRQKFAPQ
ncbi:MAG: helix-turn-helix domain-containing protein [Chloroflexota bacterium]